MPDMKDETGCAGMVRQCSCDFADLSQACPESFPTLHAEPLVKERGTLKLLPSHAYKKGTPRDQIQLLKECPGIAGYRFECGFVHCMSQGCGLSASRQSCTGSGCNCIQRRVTVKQQVSRENVLVV